MAKKVTVDGIGTVEVVSDVTPVKDSFSIDAKSSDVSRGIVEVVDYEADVNSIWTIVDRTPVTRVLNLPTGCIVHTDAGIAFVNNVRYRTEFGRFDRIM